MPTYLLSLIFGAGVIIQSLLLLYKQYNKGDHLNVVGVFFIALFILAWITGESGADGSLAGYLSAYFLIYCFVFTAFFRKRILPKIDEGTILIWNLIALYVYFSTFPNNLITTMFLMIPSIVTLLLNIVHYKVSSKYKVFLYVWYLILVVFITITMYFYKELNILSKDNPFIGLNPLSLFLYGMLTMYLLSNLYYILAFIPFPSDLTTTAMKERLEEIKSHATLLKSKYSNQQSHPIFVLLVILMISASIFLQYNFVHYNEVVFINFLLLFTQFADFGRSKKSYL